jgi:molybdenum cofactor cytidylyltransferase
VAAVIAAVILAAGESARLGQAKQLLGLGGRSLLRHAVECAIGGGCDPVFVVLGARADTLLPQLSGTAARVVRNERWREGIGSSVRAGVAEVQRGWPDACAVLLLVCDQPHLTPQLVQRVRESFDGTGGRVVACEYAGTVGVPALFERSLFPELVALSGTTGAKSVLQAHADEVVAVNWPEGAIDIDRPGDLPRLS